MTNSRPNLSTEQADLTRLASVPLDSVVSAEVNPSKTKEIDVQPVASAERLLSGPELSGTSFSFSVEKKHVKSLEESHARSAISHTPDVSHAYHELQTPQAPDEAHAPPITPKAALPEDRSYMAPPKTILDRLMDWVADVIKSLERGLLQRMNPKTTINTTQKNMPASLKKKSKREESEAINKEG